MVLRTLVRKNNSGKLAVSMQCHNIHSFIEGAILLFVVSIFSSMAEFEQTQNCVVEVALPLSKNGCINSSKYYCYQFSCAKTTVREFIK